MSAGPAVRPDPARRGGPALAWTVPDVPLPRMVPVRRRFPRPREADVVSAVHRECDRLGVGRGLGLRGRVAITAGSRGIRDIVPILRTVVERVRAAGGEPFLVAAMGSHGGGTEAGQRAVLEGLGITPAAVGAAIDCSTGTVDLGRTPSGHPAYLAAAAAAADHIVLVNRVKPHTAIRGPIESGLLKMLAIGLGKVPGATALHRLGPAEMARAVPEMARHVLARAPVAFGLAVLENAYDETAEVRGVLPGEMEAVEAVLLERARTLMPSLPADDVDLLIVEVMGKDISGTGMDTNVIGRFRLPGVADPPVPRVRRIAVLDLSPASHGNATGIGLADVTTERLVQKIDRRATYLNALTSTLLDRVKIPMALPDDRSAIAAALTSLQLDEPARARVVRIKNTLELAAAWVSEALADALAGRADVEPAGPPEPMAFDAAGRLL